jgi:hypothetical protein
MQTTEYACTHIEKRVEEDNYESGFCGAGTCTMSENINIVAPTLPGLIERLGEVYGLDIDDVWWPGDEADNDDNTRIGFNRLEDEECDTPDKRQIELWKEGKLRLWLADYDMMIEKRVVCPVTLDEFKAANIKTHS